MDDEERKEWVATVNVAKELEEKGQSGACILPTRPTIILAADAELTALRGEVSRLREAVEWAAELEIMKRYDIEYGWSASDELRKRAGIP